MSKQIVTFTKNWRGYAAGETAGFADSTAEALIEAGYATEFDSGKKPRKVPKPANKPSDESRPEPTDPPERDEKP